MNTRRQFALWIVAACASLLVLVFALRWGRIDAARRFSTSVPPQPAVGRTLFEKKGCATCHGIEGTGGPSAPSLRQRTSLSSVPKLVSAMWNHAPRMWAAMRQQKLSYPRLSYEETSQLIAYLYISGCDDSAGDVQRGATLFASTKRCSRCHAADGRDSRFASIAVNGTALDWTQALWNHAATMRVHMREAGMTWPTFQSNDIRDLFAYIRHQNGAATQQPTIAVGNLDSGWQLFQQKGCIRCHSLTSEANGIGPHLGTERKLPPTFSEFGAALLNHIPAMEHAIEKQGLEWPTFEHNDLSDLTTFLYTLRYLEPAGSAQIGRAVFSWRGCARCHGTEAEGSGAPRLRGRGQIYTASRLAADLWRHGARMYERTEHDGQPWPELQDSDVGNLLTFLNSAPDQ